MNPTTRTILNTLQLNDQLFANGVFTLDDETARRKPADNTNTILWLTGHLLISRKYLLDLFGDVRELEYEAKFRTAHDPSADYPDMPELKQQWEGISSALTAKLEASSDDDLERAVDWNLPNNDKTVRGALLFYMFHEGWHLGQIAYARKAMGMDGLVPY